MLVTLFEKMFSNLGASFFIIDMNCIAADNTASQADYRKYTVSVYIDLKPIQLYLLFP